MSYKVTVNMNTLETSKDALEEEFKELGGRGLIAQYMMKNVPPQCNTLGEENRLLFCTGLFAGTSFTTGDRLSVGGKSPLTGGIKESNSGGNFGSLLAEQGIRLLEVTGLPQDKGLYILRIDASGNVSLEDAGEYRGVNNYQLVETLTKRYGDNIAVAGIGVAGERQYKNASLQITKFRSGHPSRAAARGGLGALMGSKGIKAVVIEKPEQAFVPDYADEARFKEVVQKINKLIAQGAKKDPFHQIGTVSMIENTGATGVLPVDNFSGRLFPDYPGVGANKFMENLQKRGGHNQLPCQKGCVVQCSNIYPDKDGKYLTSSFEYETIALFGPNCHISDLDKVAQMDRLCDDIGVDTIETANTIAVCMEAGKIPWGDADAALSLIMEMAEGTDFGRLMGEGCEAVGKSLGCSRIPTVKKQSMAAYDPRNTKGTGVTYALNPMGADHTAGLTLGRAFDDCGRAGQAYASRRLQVAMCIADSMMCIFAFSHVVPEMELLGELMGARYGGDDSFDRLRFMGISILLTERAFNQKAGFTQKDDRLPEFFYRERSEATGSQFDINDYELEVLFNF